MARRARVEVEGGLYHVITRGNDRQDIFHSSEDLKKSSFLLDQSAEMSRPKCKNHSTKGVKPLDPNSVNTGFPAKFTQNCELHGWSRTNFV